MVRGRAEQVTINLRLFDRAAQRSPKAMRNLLPAGIVFGLIAALTRSVLVTTKTREQIVVFVLVAAIFEVFGRPLFGQPRRFAGFAVNVAAIFLGAVTVKVAIEGPPHSPKQIRRIFVPRRAVHFHATGGRPEAELMGVAAPFTRHRTMPDWRDIALEKEEHMTDVHFLAIDLAKRSFQVCAAAAGGPVYATGWFRARSSRRFCARRHLAL